jgi:O-antigen/teichoic acid export membrane protein
MWGFLTMQGCLCLMAPSVFKLLVDEKFFGYVSLLPTIALGFCVHALYVFASTESMRVGNFSKLAVATLLAVVAKLVFGVLLIRQYADIGAAISFATTYVVFIVFCFALNGRKALYAISPFRTLALFVASFTLYWLFRPALVEGLNVYETLKIGTLSVLGFASLFSMIAGVFLFREIKLAVRG